MLNQINGRIFKIKTMTRSFFVEVNCGQGSPIPDLAQWCAELTLDGDIISSVIELTEGKNTPRVPVLTSMWYKKAIQAMTQKGIPISTIKELKSRARWLGWTMRVGKSELVFSQEVSHGEDFSFSVEKSEDIKDVLNSIYQVFDDFDVSLYVKEHINCYVAPNIEDIVSDAHEIKNMLKILCRACS